MKVVKHELKVGQPAEAIWRAHVKNFQVTLPKVVPQHYTSIEYLDGPPLAPGGVFRITFNPASFPHFDYLKAIWDIIDHDNLCCKVTIFEGGHLGKHENATLIYTFKVEPAPDDPNSCIEKWTFEFDEVREDDFHDFIKDEMNVLAESLEVHLSSTTTK